MRRQNGLVLLGRWRIGTLAFRDETFRWTDTKDPGRNLVLPAGAIVSHRRVCRDPGNAATCFEWAFRTRDGQRYVFRDGGRKSSGGGRAGEVFVYFSAIFPAIPAETAAGGP